MKIISIQFLGSSRLFGNHVQKYESIEQKTACYIKKQVSNGSFIKCHILFPFTIYNAKIQNTKANINPNVSTAYGGLSIEGTIKGITVDPKNNCPIPIQISASLSSRETENTNLINSYSITKKFILSN